MNAAAIVAHAADSPVTSVAILALIALLLRKELVRKELVQREPVEVGARSRLWRALSRALDVAMIALLVGFALIVAVRMAEALG